MRKKPTPRPRAVKQKLSITIDTEMVQEIDKRNQNRSDEINRVLRKEYDAQTDAQKGAA